MSQDGKIGLAVWFFVIIVFLFILFITGVVKQGFNQRKNKIDTHCNSLFN
jgi:hypothetical protein